MRFDDLWYKPSPFIVRIFLTPFSLLYRAIFFIRWLLYRSGLKKIISLPVPVIVVGNITAGGTGKTPFVIWLAQFLQKHHFRPGIIMRGIGGRAHYQPILATAFDDYKKIGDEALLFLKHLTIPVAICINRVLAAQLLLTKKDCNVIISDDGLQHYSLGRQVEIVMIDGNRRFGNKKWLPVGPLRESMSRLKKVDFIVVKEGNKEDEFTLHFTYNELCAVNNAQRKMCLNEFRNKKVHVLAGIGAPDNFFNLLKEHSINIIPHVFPDHYHYQKKDIFFDDGFAVIMTEKDAVKCKTFASDNHWYLPIYPKVSNELGKNILTLLKERIHAKKI